MTDFAEAIEFAVQDLPPEHAAAVGAAVIAAVYSGRAQQAQEAVDINIPFGTGGQAFLWEDVLSLSDVLDGFNGVPGSFDDLDPAQLAKILLGLVGAWKRLRKVRVPLTEEEFKVLRAIKRGRSTISQVVTYTKLEPATVHQTIDNLRARTYRDEFSLVDDKNGSLTTRF